MIQLNALSGKMAGRPWVARHFPVRIGRAAANELRLDEEGVWDQHAELGFDPSEGFLLKAMPGALLSINQEPARTARLRNGDIIQLGAARLQFWLEATRQRGLLFRECLVWALVVAVCAAEVALVYVLS